MCVVDKKSTYLRKLQQKQSFCCQVWKRLLQKIHQFKYNIHLYFTNRNQKDHRKRFNSELSWYGSGGSNQSYLFICFVIFFLSISFCDKNMYFKIHVNNILHVIIWNDDTANSFNLLLNEPCYDFVCRFYSLVLNFPFNSIQLNWIVIGCVSLCARGAKNVFVSTTFLYLKLNKMFRLKHMCWSMNKITRFKWCNQSFTISFTLSIYSIKSHWDFLRYVCQINATNTDCCGVLIILSLDFQYKFSNTYFAMTNWTFGCHFFY